MHLQVRGAGRSPAYSPVQGVGGDVQGGVHPRCSDQKTSKYMGSWHQVKCLPLEGGVTGVWGQGVLPTRRKSRLVFTYVGIRKCLASVTIAGCVSSTFVCFDTDAESYERRKPHHVLYQLKRCKKGNIFRLSLTVGATSLHLCSN